MNVSYIVPPSFCKADTPPPPAFLSFLKVS